MENTDCIEVFATSVETAEHARTILRELTSAFPDHRFNFDLEDCDHILRAVCASGPPDVEAILGFMERRGVRCMVLQD